MGGSESKEKDAEDHPHHNGLSHHEMKEKKLKDKEERKEQRRSKQNAKQLAQVETKTLAEVVEDGKVSNVKLKLQSLRETFSAEAAGATGKAAKDVEAEVEKRLIDELNKLDGEGLSALHYAARDEYPGIAKVLLAAGADPNVTTKKGSTPLHAAAKSVHDSSTNVEDVITILINNGADVNAQDSHGTTPIHLAAYRDNVVGAEKLMQSEDLDIHLKDKEDQNVMHKAASSDANNVINVIKSKMELDDIKAVDKDGQTALHVACKYASKDCFLTLFDIFKESEQDIIKVLVKKDNEGNTPFHLATASGDKDTQDYFINVYETELRKAERENNNTEAVTAAASDGDDWSWDDDALNEPEEKILTIKQLCTVKNNQGETPLHLAAMSGTTFNVNTILMKMENKNIDVEDYKERTPLHGAVIYNNLEVVELLVDRGADIDHADENWHSTVLVASRVSTAQIVEILLRKDPVSYEIRYDTDSDEKNPLHIAAERDDPDLLKVLLKYCQDTDDYWLLDTPDRNNNTPLHIAAEKGKSDNVRALLDFNAEVDLKNADLNTPTHLAAKYGRYTAIEALSKHDHEVLTTGDEDGNTALHVACLYGHERVAKSLIQCGASIKATNRKHHTPLYIAAKKGHTKICKHLLKAGANPNVPNPSLSQDKNTDGNEDKKPTPNPLHAACAHGHAELVKLLLQFNADIKAKNDQGHNALNIAIMTGQRDVAVAIVKSPNWQDALKNESYELVPKRRKTTPLRQLIEKMPDVAEIVFNQCVYFSEEIDRDTGKPKVKTYEGKDIEMDYQFLEDELAPWKKKSLISAKKRFMMIKDIRRRHPLKIMADLKRANLLSHPLVTSLLNKKWWMTIWLYFLIFLIYAIYLVFLTGYMLVNEPPYKFKSQAGYDNLSVEDECERIRALWPESEDFSDVKRRLMIDIGQWVVLVVSCISVLGEILQFIYRGRKYIKSIENYIDLLSYILAIFLVVSPNSCQRETGIRTDLQWQLGAFAMFLSWINLVLFYKMFPKLGMYVYMFNAITETFLSVLRVFALYIIAFGLTFYVLLQNQIEFENVWDAIVKSSIMSTGEFEFADIMFGLEENPGDKAHMVHYTVLVQILLLVFASMMTILLMNLLVGLAVGDIQGLQTNATVQKLRIQVEQTLDAEYYWLFRAIRWELQKRVMRNNLAQPTDSDYDDLKAIAMVEREEQQQLSIDATREEMNRRMEKHMTTQNAQLTELFDKIENQERRTEETQRMLRKVLRQLNADKDSEKLPFKLKNNTDSELKMVLDWGGILKTSRFELGIGDGFETVLEDEPHTLYLFMEDTKLAHSFKPGKVNEYVVTKDETFMILRDQDGDEKKENIFKIDNTAESEDDSDW